MIPNMVAINEIHKMCISNPDLINKVKPEIVRMFKYNYLSKLRPLQRYDTMFKYTNKIVNLSGRSSGKSYSAGCYLYHYIMHEAEEGENLLMVAPTHEFWATVITGKHSLLGICPPGLDVIDTSGSNKKLFFPQKNVTLLFKSAEAIVRSRGINASMVFFEEMCMIPNQDIEEVYNTVKLTNRVKFKDPKKQPKILITSTPQPSKFIRDLISGAEANKIDYQDVIYIKESTYANQHNLATSFISDLEKIIDSDFGRQEIYGDILMDDSTFLFDNKYIKRSNYELKDLLKVFVAIDPATTANSGSDETGIILAGINKDKNLVILQDLSGKYTPTKIAEIVEICKIKYNAQYCVVETNQGGDWVSDTLKTKIKVFDLRSVASKLLRAEKVNPFWQSGKIFLNGRFKQLEDQLSNFSYKTKNDDRVDAFAIAGFECFNLYQKGIANISMGVFG